VTLYLTKHLSYLCDQLSAINYKLLMDNCGLGVTMILSFEMDILHEKGGWFLLVMQC